MTMFRSAQTEQTKGEYELESDSSRLNTILKTALRDHSHASSSLKLHLVGAKGVRKIHFNIAYNIEYILFCDAGLILWFDCVA